MKVQVLCVGTIKESFFKKAIEEYKKRISKFATVEICEVAESKLSANPSKKEIEQALKEERKRMEKKILPGAYVTVLAIEGKQTTSEDFSENLQRNMTEGYSCFTFVIGSSYGLSHIFKQQYHTLSFSKMTFPHQLMRVILLEQLYRAFKILNHETYHK